MRRSAFTLVEMLIAIGIVLILTAIALVIVPGALDQNRTVDATSTVQAALRNARARALRDQESRGVRFVVEAGKPGIATTLQHVGSMPMLVPKKGSPSVDQWPRVDLMAVGGTIRVYLRNLAPEDLAAVQGDLSAGVKPRLHMPEIVTAGVDRSFFRILALTPAGSDFEMTLDRVPHLGAGTERRVYHFAFLLEPKPLVGEPPIPLPKGTAVDLNASKPASAGDVELIFTRDGQMAYEGTEQVYLWIRDPSKAAAALVQTSPGVYDLAPFKTGGEQRVIQIMTRTGATAAYAPLWPRDDGTYPANQTPWTK